MLLCSRLCLVFLWCGCNVLVCCLSRLVGFVVCVVVFGVPCLWLICVGCMGLVLRAKSLSFTGLVMVLLV